MWHGLKPTTRKAYESPISQWEQYAAMRGSRPWPVQESLLQQYVVDRATGTEATSQISATTIEGYLSAMRSHEVDLRLPPSALSPVVKRLLRGVKSLQPATHKDRLPILPDILQSILTIDPQTTDDFTINAALTIAFAGFLRLGEITHTNASKSFAVTRSDITVANDHLVLRLRRSKADIEHHGVTITIAATGAATCPVGHMRQLLLHQPALTPLSPLFQLASNTGFPKHTLVRIIKQRLHLAGHQSTAYSGHSLRRGAAQHAANIGLTDAEIKLLGRWSSESFRLYFTTPQSTIYRLNHRFQTGQPLPMR
jgi:integrase